MPALDLRLSETDTRPMLDPREGRGEVVLGLTGAAGEGVVVPGETAGWFRCGREDEVEDERDGGREFRSGGMVNEMGMSKVLKLCEIGA